jgi:HEPN domain-containing protein
MDWFNKAKAELESAEILMAHDGNCAVITFLCQQTIEKAYKGFILREKGDLIGGHSLIYLCSTPLPLNITKII